MGESNWCLNCCSFLIALIFPPLGVVIKFGCGKEFCLCVFLCLLGWIPGIAYAVIATCCLSVENYTKDGIPVTLTVISPPSNSIIVHQSEAPPMNYGTMSNPQSYGQHPIVQNPYAPGTSMQQPYSAGMSVQQSYGAGTSTSVQQQQSYQKYLQYLKSHAPPQGQQFEGPKQQQPYAPLEDYDPDQTYVPPPSQQPPTFSPNECGTIGTSHCCQISPAELPPPYSKEW